MNRLCLRGHWLLLVCLIIALGGCGPRKASKTPIVQPDMPQAGMVEDVRLLPQDLLAYAGKAPNRRLISQEEQAKQDARFNRLYFGPWSATKTTVKASEAFALFGGKNGTSRPRGWAENLLPWTKERWDRLVANADRASFPSRQDKAITVCPTVLREAPTHLPRFGNPATAGQGFPFDLFMYSSLPTGMPLLIIHTSADGAWVYVETALVSGWVPTRDVALVDEPFRKKYQNGPYAVILHDDVSLRNSLGQYLTTAHLGTVLPAEEPTSSGLTLLVPVRNTQGYAQMARVHVSATEAAVKPLPLTAGNVARIGNVLIGQPYGWGGLLENRDCSLTLRDVFTPFGLWLPRNSASQAKAWDFVTFGNADDTMKEQIILNDGIPFATLLWLKGHIGLYLGQYKGQPVMFHNIWGIRTESEGKEGRYILGRTLVTTLRPGVELPDVQDARGLIARMRGMSVLH